MLTMDPAGGTPGTLGRRGRGWIFRAARAVLLGLGISAGALALLLMALGDSFIYHPSVFPEGNWEARKRSPVPVEEVSFPAADGTELVAWYARPRDPRATVLYLHGNAGHVADRLPFLELMASLDLECFGVDWRGYGKSRGSPSEAGLLSDAEGAWTCLTSRYGVDPSRIVIYGESLGAAPAIELAARRPAAGLVTQAAFTSVRDMARTVTPWFPSHWFVRARYDNLSAIPRVAIPKLLVHGRDDEIVPFAQGARLFAAAREPKWFSEIAGAGHNDLVSGHTPEFLADLREFLKRIGR